MSIKMEWILFTYFTLTFGMANPILVQSENSSAILTSIIAPPSLTQLPPSEETLHHVYYNGTPEEFPLESKSLNLTNLTLNQSSSSNSSNDSNSIIQKENFLSKNSSDFQLNKEKIELIRQANESLVSFLKHIEDQIEKQILVLNDTVQIESTKLGNLSHDQNLVRDSNLLNQITTNGNTTIFQIVKATEPLLKKIHEDLNSLENKFEQFAKSLLQLRPTDTPQFANKTEATERNLEKLKTIQNGTNI